MRAALYETYGPPSVVCVVDVPEPVPGPNDLLVRIHATTVTSADVRVRSLTLPLGFGLIGRPVFGFRGPRRKILGMEFSGVVETAGKDVVDFRSGDRVFGMTGLGMGCHAEKRVVPAQGNVLALPPAFRAASRIRP